MTVTATRESGLVLRRALAALADSLFNAAVALRQVGQRGEDAATRSRGPTWPRRAADTKPDPGPAPDRRRTMRKSCRTTADKPEACVLPLPPDTGQRLATIPRGTAEELRVSWTEYNGKRYLSLRIWRRDRDGNLWPQRGRGLLVHEEEVAALADAVGAGVDMATAYVAESPQTA